MCNQEPRTYKVDFSDGTSYDIIAYDAQDCAIQAIFTHSGHNKGSDAVIVNIEAKILDDLLSSCNKLIRKIRDKH